MIRVQDWIASIPDEEKHIAYVGEGMSETREFWLCGDGWEKYKEWSFHLDMAFDPESITTRDSRQVVQTRLNRAQMKETLNVTVDETVTKETYVVKDEKVLDYYLTDIAPLTKTVEEEGIRLSWTVLRQHTVLPGKLWTTLRAVDSTANMVKKSAIMVFEVDAAVCAVPAARPAISEMEQIEARAAAAADTAHLCANRVEDLALSVESMVQLADDHAYEAQQQAAKAQQTAQTVEAFVQLADDHAYEAQQCAATAAQAAKSAQEMLDAVTGNHESVCQRVAAMEETLFGNSETENDSAAETVSVTNLLKNPQYKDGMTDWEWVNQSCEVVTVGEDGMCLSLEAANKVSYQLRQKLTKATFIVGHRYYLRSRVKIDGVASPNGTVEVYMYGVSNGNVAQTMAAKTGWSYASALWDLTALPSGSLGYCVYMNYTGTKDYTTLYDTKIYFYSGMLIDLTATFGEGNEPDIATMDRWMTEQYALGFEGTAALALTAEDSGEEESSSDGLVDKVADLEGDVVALQDEVAHLTKTVTNSSASVGTQTGTVYPVLEAQYIANIEEARPKYYNAGEPNTLTFAMLADIHASPAGGTAVKNVEASSAWAKLVGHDFVVLGGDLLNDSKDFDRDAALSVIDTVMEMAEKHARCPVYAVKGNHDTNELATGNENRLTDAEFYRHANVRGEKYGMGLDPAHPYGGYYYVDFPRLKIRMVCLNTSEDYPDVDLFDPNVGDGAFRHIGVFSENQMAWVKEVALRVDEGWAVMMVSHIPPFQAENFGNRGTDNPNLRALCETFAAGTGDFAQQGAREFIGHFCGHAHVDAYNKVGGLNYVVVNCTFPHAKVAGDPLYLDRTANEDKLSLNSFIIDRANRRVKCIKIGAAPAEDYEGWTDSFTW